MQISRYGGVRVVYGRNSHVDTTCHNAAVKGSATAVVSGLSSAAVVIHSECSVCGLQTNEVMFVPGACQCNKTHKRVTSIF